MQIQVTSGAPAALRAGALVVPVFADGNLDGATEAVNAALGGAIADVLSSGEIKGGANETSLIHTTALAARHVLVVGLGDRKTFEPSLLARYAGTAVLFLGKRNVRSIAFTLPLEARHHTGE